MFRLLHLPFIAYELVMMWADHKSLHVEPMPPCKNENRHRFATPKVQNLGCAFSREGACE